MKIGRKSLCVIALLVVSLMLLSGSGRALQYEHSYEDDKGDVSTKILESGGESVDNPDIDITKIETEKEGSNITFMLKVDGEIRKESPENESYSYAVHIINEPNLTALNGDTGVLVQYRNDNCEYFEYNTTEFKETGSTVNEGKLTMKVPEEAFSELSEFHFVVMTINDIMGTPKDGGDSLKSWEAAESDGEDETGMPGFGILVFIASLPVATYVYRKRK